jgi:hypothetical protein
MHVKFAMVAPVTKPTAHEAGKPNRSSSQPSAICSIFAPAGDMISKPAFWSQAAAIQFAAKAAGSTPPWTNPK